VNAQEAADILGVNRRRHGDLREMVRALTLFPCGLRWWFVCPRENRRVRKLHLALGGRHFWSRRAYELAYASQREERRRGDGQK
jgi:hypothetical protein